MSDDLYKEYGKIVEYNFLTGEFRDIFKTNDFELLSFGLHDSDLFEIVKYCNCDCQWKLTSDTMLTPRVIRLRAKIEIHHIDKKNMFNYLVDNFLQHAESVAGLIRKLENLYKNGSYDINEISGNYNFEKGSEFDLLLENLVTKSPCFRRYLANASHGWTLLRILELCFMHQMKDVNYNNMISMIFVDIGHPPRFDFIVAQLKTWPYYRINSLLDNTLTPCTLAHSILYVDQVTHIQYFKHLEHLLDPRSAHIKMDWKCKRLFLVAKYKPARDCPFSTIPMDILKYILHLAEIFSLPRAVSFELTQEEEEDKINANRPLSWVKKMFGK